MRIALYIFSATVIISMSLYDSYFAYTNRHTFVEWELNPIAIWLYKLIGMQGMILLKISILILFIVVSAPLFIKGNKVATIGVTLTVVAHLFLAGYYGVLFL